MTQFIVQMSLKCDLSANYFQALFNGAVKLFVYGDTSVSIELIRDQVFKGSKGKAVDELLSALSKLVRAAAYGNWSVNELEDHLKTTSLLPEHTNVALKFWSSERSKVHEHMIGKTVWNRRIDGRLAWRVDTQHDSKQNVTQTKSEDIDETEPTTSQNSQTAIFQLNTKEASGSSLEDSLVWEMNKEQLQSLVCQFDQISDLLKEKTQND